MAFLYIRSGVVRAEKSAEAIKGIVGLNQRFREASGVTKGGVYHQIGGDIGRIQSLLVFDDISAGQKALTEYYSDPKNREISAALGEYFVPLSTREILLMSHTE